MKIFSQGLSFAPEVVASPTSWQSAPSTGHLPLGPPLLHGSDFSQNTYHMNPFTMPLPPVHQQQQQHQSLQGSVEPKINFHLTGEHMHYGGISYTSSHTAKLPPHSQPESNFHPNSVSGRRNAQTKKQHCAQQHMHDTAESGHAQIAFDQWQLPVIVKVEKQQSLNSDQNNKDIAEDSKKSEDCKEKNNQFERKKVYNPNFNRSPPDKGSHLQTASPRYVLHCLAVTINTTLVLHFHDNKCHSKKSQNKIISFSSLIIEVVFKWF